MTLEIYARAYPPLDERPVSDATVCVYSYVILITMCFIYLHVFVGTADYFMVSSTSTIMDPCAAMVQELFPKSTI